jgi:hypothetical protein
MTTSLSPTAQAVQDAYHEEAIDYIESWGSFSHKCGMAAALRAAADQVVGLEPCGYDCCITQCEQIRAEFLAIAAELEAQQ